MKLKRLGVIILIGIIAAFLALNSYTAKNSSITYELQYFDRNELCNRILNMYYGQSNTIGLGVEESIYTEQVAKEVEQKIQNDIKTLEGKLKQSSDELINVYVIPTPLESGIYIGEKQVYCTLDEIADNTYRAELVRAYYGLTEPAIIHGLTGYIFGEATDIQSLSDYYHNNSDTTVLDLFGARFYPEWNTPEELQLAVDTATALVTYLIEMGKEETVLSEDIQVEDKRNWLQSIGVNQMNESQYEGFFNQFTYSQSKEYSLILDSEEVTYYISKDRFLSTVNDVLKFLQKDDEGRSYVLNYLKDNAPIHYESLKKDIKPEYYLSQSLPTLGGVTRAGGKIWLATPFPHLHEYSHILTVGSKESNKLWMQEGLADYLSQVIYPHNYTIELDFESARANNLSEFPEQNIKAFDYYKQHGGSFESNNIDARLYIDAYAYASLNSQENLIKDAVPIGEKYDATYKELAEGNELTYSQAASFTAYLIEQYDLDTYLSYYIGDQKNNSFETCFGLPYKKAKDNWLEYLSMRDSSF